MIKNNLKNIFKENNFVIPDYNNINIVDLVKVLYSRYGINFKYNQNMKYLDKLIPNKKHTLFILIDGMGSNLVESLPHESILKSNKIDDMITVCPTSTGCVLTSLLTATYPIEHGMLGWYNYSRKYNKDYHTLLFTDRKNNKNLTEYNISDDSIYRVKSKLNKLNVITNVLYPNNILNSNYSKFTITDEKRIGYNDIEDAISKILDILKTNEKTFTYLYLSDIDNLEHDNGVYSKTVLDELKKIEENIKKLKNEKELSIVITSDHGQIDINEDIIMDFSKYNKYFYAYPSIDFGCASYYVKDEYKEEFVNKFNKDFKDKMFLFDSNEFIDNNIFGEKVNNSYLKENIGEYISVCKNGYCFINSVNINEYIGITKGNHSGFSKEEITIPLIIINNKN